MLVPPDGPLFVAGDSKSTEPTLFTNSVLSFERANPDFGLGRIDDFADRNNLKIVPPVSIIDFVFRLDRGIQPQRRTG
jgi:hypothetical protein